MKLPELLKKAVEGADWKMVCAAYTAITGEPLSPPKAKPVINFAEIEIPDELLSLPEGDGTTNEEDDDEIGMVAPLLPPPIIIPGDDEPEPPVKKKESSFLAPSRRANVTPRNEGGKQGSRKESMSIPRRGERANRFTDDPSKEKKKELLRTHNPQLEKLYGSSGHRVERHELEDTVDTGQYRDVECSLCHSPDTVQISLSHGYDADPLNNTYRCNSCSTGSGRAKALRSQK